ncbi:unnamed protein product [Chrysodeixis includens]|uniref:Uncharacterized protein n=1 Tax=Chrysodeixis includens TaxID=689277 RepID=A0A9N8KVQ7_CHRIL|nr:unnamed protein product [Chrysodeixis includens]
MAIRAVFVRTGWVRSCRGYGECESETHSSGHRQSMEVDRGLYNSDWWHGDVRVRKQLLLLAGKLNQPFVLHAGPYTTLSVPTFIESFKVDGGLYSSAWWSQNVRIRRSFLLLGGQLRRTITFKAGPFTMLNVATFVAILKGSYSYFTLLDKKDV